MAYIDAFFENQRISFFHRNYIKTSLIGEIIATVFFYYISKW